MFADMLMAWTRASLQQHRLKMLSRQRDQQEGDLSGYGGYRTAESARSRL